MNPLAAEGLGLRIDGRWLLKGVDFALRPGEMLGLIGPNGAGKSTLLRLLTGLRRPTAGQVRLDGVPLERIAPYERARAIGYLAQNTVAHWPVAVERILELGRIPRLESWRRPGPEDAAVVEAVIRRTDIAALRERAVNTLSGGEKARVLLARALVTEPRILLADEPVAALDPSHQLDVMALIRAHCLAGGSAVVVLHDLRLAAHYCDRFQLLTDGRTLAVGDADAVLTEQHLARAFQIALGDGFESVADAVRLSWKPSRGSVPAGKGL